MEESRLTMELLRNIMDVGINQPYRKIGEVIAELLNKKEVHS